MLKFYNLPLLAFFIIAFNLIDNLPVFSQDEVDAKQMFIEAESYFLFEEFKDALPLYQKIARLEPQNYNVQYKIGICYLNNPYLKQKAIKYLELAAQNINLKYKENNYKEKLAPLESYYYLGKAYHINNMLDKAIDNYAGFKKMADPDFYDLTIVNEDIEACNRARVAMNDPVYLEVNNAGTQINSQFEDINPVLSGDEKTLIFARKLQFYDGVFISFKNEDGSWTAPVNLTPEFGLDGNSYSTGITYFGDEIFVYRSDDYDGNIYSSKRVGEKWSKLTKLNDNINTKFWESHASPSPDGQYLFFTSNRSGGYGGLDVYKSRRSANGQWGEAVNMGPVINSPSNEETPFLTNEGYSLFFSSQGHKTIGGYDIFVSHLQSNGAWSKPINMGYPLNTTEDDLFYNPTGANTYGYYSFYKDGAGLGLMDIYLTEVYNSAIPRTFNIRGRLNLDQTKAKDYKKITVKLLDAETGEIVNESKVNADGTYSLSAKQGSYVLLIEGSGIKPFTRSVSLNVVQAESKVMLETIDLSPEEGGVEIAAVTPVMPAQKIEVKNDFFAVSDSSAVPISLTLPGESDLQIDISVDGEFYKTDSIKGVKKKFTYFYKPKPGENILKFTATDADGNISSAEVIVTYYPPVKEAEITKLQKPELKTPGDKISGFQFVQIDALKEYLEGLNLAEFSNYYALYSHLKEVSKEEEFTVDEIKQFCAVLFTQKDNNVFKDELTNVTDTISDKWLEQLDSSSVPIDFLQKLSSKGEYVSNDLNRLLMEILIAQEGSGQSVLENLYSFTDKEEIGKEGLQSNLSKEQILQLYFSDKEISGAQYSLHLAATTDELFYFYQNIIIASSDNLRSYLTGMNFESEGILNSIYLVEHLFEKAEEGIISEKDLLNALELISSNKNFYLSEFSAILTGNATGSLKSQLLLMNLEEEEINTYGELLDHLVQNSQYKNYTKEEVYKLFIDLTGITDVKKFAEKIRSYNYIAINKALSDTTLKYFSNPFELIQYLLSVSPEYDFTESDINNLLIQMILERGLDDKELRAYSKGTDKFWKTRKFRTTIILINILLIILIILFSLRRKNKD
ncbi:MAG: PD40 domain-containing protein [Bacteroidales bacterium]|nr:PD40 domain-containing protein [Bacteroidales bacterium]